MGGMRMKRWWRCWGVVLLVVCAGCSATRVSGLHPEAAAFAQRIEQPAVDAVIGALHQAMAGEMTAVNALQAKRRTYDTPPPAGVALSEITLAGCPTRLYTPDTLRAEEAVVLYLHGGGWVLGVVEEYARFCGDLAQASGVRVAVMTYRLAPEHPFPAGLMDVFSAVEELQAMGYRKVYLAGDSAGGNFAAVAGLHFRERLAGVVLLYPVTWVANDGSDSWQRYRQGCGLPDDLMLAFCEAYLQNAGTDAQDPRVSPLFAKDVSHFPRTLLLAASHDILHDQGVAFYDRLKAAGVEAEYVLFPGAIHSFLTYPGQKTDYRKALEATVRFLSEAR